MKSISYAHQLIALVKRIAFIMLLFSLTRLIFFVFNYSDFHSAEPGQLFKSFFFGVRFDWATVYYCNLLFILLSLIPSKFSSTNSFQSILKYLFVLMNVILIALNIIDVGYFPVTKRRSGWDMLVMLYNDPGTVGLLKTYLLGYWYLFLIWGSLIFVLIKYYPRFKQVRLVEIKQKGLRIAIYLFIGLFIFGGGFAVARGLEGKPLRLISANDYVSPKYTSLLINTPFCVVNTMGHKVLDIKQYMSNEEAVKIYSPLQNYKNGKDFKKKNVVLFILESFSTEYLKMVNSEGKSFTPFIDSLITEGLFCSNAVANSSTSRDAVPAIMAGFPSLKGIDYMGSKYSTNKFQSLPEILIQQGYNASFFHGGHNGTMSFDKFTRAAGIENYYGYNEYIAEVGSEGDDGAWGISDHYFLSYMVDKINTFKEPFFSSVFTLSSHDPYIIPKEFKAKFPKGKLPMLESIAYTDYSLRVMFEKMKKEPWYNNTLFVFVADHTSISLSAKYKIQKTSFSIPILFFAPSDSTIQGNFKGIAQQTDIMPTILDYLNYQKSFVAYGTSIFNAAPRFAVNYKGTFYQIVDSTYSMLFDGERAQSLYNYKSDTMHVSNLSDGDNTKAIKESLENKLKAYVQNYEYRMVYNRMADTASLFEIAGN